MLCFALPCHFTTGSPAALHELLHELGHAVHLVISSAVPTGTTAPGVASTGAAGKPPAVATTGDDGGGRVYMHFGGMQLPLDVLEVPSSLLQTLAYDPAALARICRRRCSRVSSGLIRHDPSLHHCDKGGSIASLEDVVQEHDAVTVHDVASRDDAERPSLRKPQLPAAEAEAAVGDSEACEVAEELEALPDELCVRVAEYLAAENCGAVSTLHKVICHLMGREDIPADLENACCVSEYDEFVRGCSEIMASTPTSA